MIKNSKENAIVRLVVLVVLLINQALVTFGYNPLPFSDEQIYEAISVVAVVVATIYAWWRNNNITPEALAGQGEIERLKGVGKNDRKY